MDLDKVMDEVGHFGKFQGLCYFLLSFSIFYAAIAGLSYAFTTANVKYRCRIAECDAEEAIYQPEWLRNAVPFNDDKPSSCERYLSRSNSTSADGFPINNETSCLPDTFDNSSMVKCRDWVFDNEEWTIANEWKFTSCFEKQWRLTIVGTVNNIGQFVGFPLAGYFSDRVGRKKTLLVSIIVTCLLGVLRSFAWCYEAFLFFEFVVAGFSGGIYNSGFILGMELVGPRARVIGGAVISCFYSAGMVLLAAVALWVKNWRILQAIYAPGLICFVYYWILPESVRWLQSQGRTEEVKTIMLRAAKINGVKLSEQEFSKFELSPVVAKTEDETPVQKRSNSDAFKRIFKSKILLARLINCAFCWITNSFVYIGLSLSAVSVGGDKYTNFILVAVVEIPAYAVTPFFSDRFGRRLSLCVSLLIAGVCCVAFAFIPEGYDTAKLVVFLAGKFAITIAFTVVYVFTAELFPTELRHSMLGTCSMVGRIGSIIAPQTPLLAEIYKALPFFLFGGISVASGLLILLIPETLNQKLPDTVEEAENLGKRQNT
ncbi:organic cation transporter protein-like [Zootermopsis nevadensis]|uniref:organic cation transporter protein-like n=1 Tax=Zootermopsis nevadensis TaxID=136037 RepID=UPI000B8ED790|nr:organic cation transporter protein-like [Zootermopsis nevadensis]XP_021942806.1 organic cation transporter protein-like [Zootermopsis nevadensis]